MPATPQSLGAALSLAVKAVLLALVSTGILPWDGEQVASVALAVSTVADVALYLGLIRPRPQAPADEHEPEHAAAE